MHLCGLIVSFWKECNSGLWSCCQVHKTLRFKPYQMWNLLMFTKWVKSFNGSIFRQTCRRSWSPFPVWSSRWSISVRRTAPRRCSTTCPPSARAWMASDGLLWWATRDYVYLLFFLFLTILQMLCVIVFVCVVLFFCFFWRVAADKCV